MKPEPLPYPECKVQPPHPITHRDYWNDIMDAMQNCEEMGGPEDEAYITFMEALVVHVQSRISNAKEGMAERKRAHWDHINALKGIVKEHKDLYDLAIKAGLKDEAERIHAPIVRRTVAALEDLGIVMEPQ